MFSSDENVVTLGVVSANQNLDHLDNKRKSRIGGHPVWQSSNSPISGEAQCKRCSKTITFVGQVYAPTDVDRSLYFFCCPSSCSSSSLGWLVYRDQSDISMIENALPISSSPLLQTTTDWNALCDSSERDGDCGDDGDEDFSDIMALLDSRDGAGAKQQSLPSKREACTTSTKSLETKATSDHAPNSGIKFYILEELEEPIYNVRIGAAGSDHVDELVMRYLSEMRGDGTGGAGDTEGQSDAAQLSRIEEEYSRERSSRQQGDVDAEDVDEDVDDDEEGLEIRSAVAGLVQRGQAISTDGGRKKQRAKAEATFHSRIERCPGQILRYAYGGSPLWCTSPAPSTSCPPCEGCGAERVFEMQLMPGLISLLPRAHSSATVCTDSLLEVTEGGEISSADLLSNDIDFGVVTVWSCPNSCNSSKTEIVIVQASSDCI